MKEHLAERLMELPETISTIELEILTKSQTVQELSDRILDLEAEIKSSINGAIDADGKKVYSNDQARQLAFVIDCKEDGELNKYYLQRTLLQNEIATSRIEVEKLSNTQRNLRIVISSVY
jgi:hypothetical protein